MTLPLTPWWRPGVRLAGVLSRPAVIVPPGLLLPPLRWWLVAWPPHRVLIIAVG